MDNGTTLFKSYTQTYAQGAYYGDQSDFIQRDFSFYWIFSNLTESIQGGNPTTLGIIAHVPGIKGGDDLFNTMNNNVQVNYSVLGPTNVSMTSTTGTVGVSNNPAAGGAQTLSFGLPSPNTPGIAWTFSATGPSNAIGDISAIQLVDTYAAQTIAATATPTQGPPPNTCSPPSKACTIYKLDQPKAGDVLYANHSTQILAGQAGTWKDEDSPYKLLWDLSYVQRQDQFQTWFVYKPRTANAIWVPLGYLQWNWTGTATLSGGVWDVSGASWSQNPSAVIPNSYTSIPFPAWAGHLP